MKKLRVTIDLEAESDLTKSFLAELGKRVAEGNSASRAELGRRLFVEALESRGHEIDQPGTKWGRPSRKSKATA
jgi:hypothetical protein